MKLFQLRDICVSEIKVIADDPTDAIHMFLDSLQQSIGYFPHVSYKIEEFAPSDDTRDQMEAVLEQRSQGFLHFDKGWKVFGIKS